MKRYIVPCAAALLFIAAASLGAQQLSVAGSASGWGLGALTEARMADAVFTNPALAKLPDSAPTSFSLLSLDAGSSNGEAGLFSGATLAKLAMFGGQGRSVPRDGFQFTPNLDIVWAAAHSGGLAFGARTTAFATFSADAGVASAMRRDSAFTDVTGPSHSSYIALTTLAVSDGGYLGRLPIVGEAWAGAVFKYTMLHAAGEFEATSGPARDVAAVVSLLADEDLPVSPDATAYALRGPEIRGVRVMGADLGVLVNPAGTLLVSAVMQNLYEASRFGGASLHLREMWDLGDGNHHGRSSEGTMADDLRAEFGRRIDVDSMARELHFGRALRSAASLNIGKNYRVSGGYLFDFDQQAIRSPADSRWSVAAGMSTGLMPRIALSSLMNGEYALGVAITREGCSAKHTIGTRVHYRSGRVDGLDLTLSHVFAPSCTAR